MVEFLADLGGVEIEADMAQFAGKLAKHGLGEHVVSGIPAETGHEEVKPQARRYRRTGFDRNNADALGHDDCLSGNSSVAQCAYRVHAQVDTRNFMQARDGA